jgi:hypothetical protein
MGWGVFVLLLCALAANLCCAVDATRTHGAAQAFLGAAWVNELSEVSRR